MRVLSIHELGLLKGIVFSRAQIYRMIKEGRFPRPIRLGEQRVAWVEKEIDEWLASKIVERDEPAEEERIKKRSRKARQVALSGSAA